MTNPAKFRGYGLGLAGDEMRHSIVWVVVLFILLGALYICCYVYIIHLWGHRYNVYILDQSTTSCYNTYIKGIESIQTLNPKPYFAVDGPEQSA